MLSKFIFIYFCAVFGVNAVEENNFKYFNEGINYWTEEIPKKEVIKEKKEELAKSFNWQKYLDPKNDEFFKEGEYTPPAPFMELARNPNDQNIKNWIDYNNLKNQLSERLRVSMETYMAKHSDIKSNNKEEVMSVLKNKSSIDPSRYRVRMFFDSNCSHCKKMFETLLELQKAGIYVEALQINNEEVKKLSYPLPIRMASAEEIKQHQITSVPLTLIADLKKKVLYPPVKGYQDFQTVMQLLNEAQKL